MTTGLAWPAKRHVLPCPGPSAGGSGGGAHQMTSDQTDRKVLYIGLDQLPYAHTSRDEDKGVEHTVYIPPPEFACLSVNATWKTCPFPPRPGSIVFPRRGVSNRWTSSPGRPCASWEPMGMSRSASCRVRSFGMHPMIRCAIFGRASLSSGATAAAATARGWSRSSRTPFSLSRRTAVVMSGQTRSTTAWTTPKHLWKGLSHSADSGG
jgi:hypothetical protein